jgi:hypothetical protein
MTTLPSDSEILEYHYNYELDMLANTFRLLNDNRIQQNALIESFCLHARNLIEFFCDKNKGHKYTEKYTPFEGKKTRVEKLNRLINQQISHLDVSKRTADDSRKISGEQCAELITILITETEKFYKHLIQPYREMSISVLMRQQMSTASQEALAGKDVRPAENIIYVVGFGPSGSATTTTASETFSTGVLVGKVDNSPP